VQENKEEVVFQHENNSNNNNINMLYNGCVKKKNVKKSLGAASLNTSRFSLCQLRFHLMVSNPQKLHTHRD